MPFVLLFFCVLILISTASVATWVSAQCASFAQPQAETLLSAPNLHHVQDQVFTKYKKIRVITVRNTGGHFLTRCEGYNLPEGLRVTVSANQRTCVISGVPAMAQAQTPGFIVATNSQGSSLAKVAIVVNALVLVE